MNLDNMNYTTTSTTTTTTIQTDIYNGSTNNNISPKSGYDLPLYGIDSGQSLAIHVPALTCIIISLFSAFGVLIFSFRAQSFRTFFKWTKSERFVVYLALCDGLFNICHSMDHLHIVISRDHVYPKILCRFYGFMLAEFVTAQNLMVNLVSINAFVLIYLRRHIEFGKYDHRLLLWMFGLPFVASIIALSLDTFGPNGTFCYFDGVSGILANLFFTTIPLVIILLVNIILYFLTWLRIRDEEPKFKDMMGKEAKIIRASHRAARTMSLFVAAFIIQWWALAVFGFVQMVQEVPRELFQSVTIFSNVGGILNGIVYIIILKRSKEKHSSDGNSDYRSDHSKSFQNLNNFNRMNSVECPLPQVKNISVTSKL